MSKLVSVIMGVHNEKEEYLKCSIESICNQTYGNLEFIIIDDASEVKCGEMLDKMASDNPIIKVIHNAKNLGLTKSLNIGLDQAKGEYIARMDADDYSVPDRIKKQVAFMEEHEDIAICGSGVISFGDKQAFMSPWDGFSNEEAQCYLFFSSTLCHPSVMIRKEFLDSNNIRYDESFKKGQDYDLWERCSIVGKLAVMKEVLLFYRIHGDQITTSDKQSQDQTADVVRVRRISRLGITPSEQDYRCHRLLNGGVDEEISCEEMKKWANKLISANNHIGFVDDYSFARMLSEMMTLFKMRNHRFFNLINATDVFNMMKIVESRLSQKNKLRKCSVNLVA